MVEPLRHRQTKEAATDMFCLKPPRHISTLHLANNPAAPMFVRFRTIAGIAGSWPAMGCPLMTQSDHFSMLALSVSVANDPKRNGSYPHKVSLPPHFGPVSFRPYSRGFRLDVHRYVVGLDTKPCAGSFKFFSLS